MNGNRFWLPGRTRCMEDKGNIVATNIGMDIFKGDAAVNAGYGIDIVYRDGGVADFVPCVGVVTQNQTAIKMAGHRRIARDRLQRIKLHTGCPAFQDTDHSGRLLRTGGNVHPDKIARCNAALFQVVGDGIGHMAQRCKRDFVIIFGDQGDIAGARCNGMIDAFGNEPYRSRPCECRAGFKRADNGKLVHRRCGDGRDILFRVVQCAGQEITETFGDARNGFNVVASGVILPDDFGFLPVWAYGLHHIDQAKIGDWPVIDIDPACIQPGKG